jgi:hypothetical protein
MPRHDLSDLSDMDLARLLGSKGRGGDTLVAHINPTEALVLRALGGRGSVNPKTGLLEFLGGIGSGAGGALGRSGDTGMGSAGPGKVTSRSGSAGGRNCSCNGNSLLDYLAHLPLSGVGYLPQEATANRPGSSRTGTGPGDMNIARLLGRQGRHGDTIVAHISPSEALLLHLLGGAGTRNPKTGLLEFSPMGGQAGGRDGTGTGSSSAKSGRGPSGDHNGPAGTGVKDNSSQGGGVTNIGSKYGNENAAIGVLSQHAANVTRARNAMSIGAPGAAVKDTANPQSDLSRAWHGFMQSIGLEDDPDAQANPDSVSSVVKDVSGYGSDLTSGPLSAVLSAMGFGAQLGDEAQDKIDKINAGIEAGSVVDTSQGQVGVQNGAAYGGGINSGTTDVSRLSHDIANGSFTGGDLGGYARDHNNDGRSSPNHTSIAQNAQQNNAGGGLIAAFAPILNPAAPAPVNPNLPAGLLQYLAQNPGLLQGYTGPSRFGTGSVAPLNYMRSYA